MHILGNLLVNVTFLSGLVIFWFLSAGLGLYLLRVLKIIAEDVLERFLIATALGWLVLGYIIYGLGLLGILYAPVLLLVTVFLLILTWREKPWSHIRMQAIRRSFAHLSRLGKIIAVLLGIPILITLCGALAPDIEFDSTWYHLSEARLYLEEHHTRILFPSVLDKSSVAPRLPEMLFTYVLAPYRTASTLPQLVAWLSGVGLILGTYAAGRRFLRREYALLAALMIASTKIIGWLAQTAYVDLTQAFFGIAVIIAFFVWRDRREKQNMPLVVALLFGGFLASKMQSLAFFPVLLFGILALHWEGRSQLKSFVHKSWRDIFLISFISLLVAAPWYLEIWAATGSVLFTFDRPPGDEHLGGGSSFVDWVFHIHPKTFLGDIYEIFLGSAPLYLASLTAFLFWKKLPGGVKILLVAGTLAIVCWSYIPVHLDRYGLIVFSLLAIPLAWLAQTYIWLRLASFLAIGVVVVLNSALLVNLTWLRFPVAFGIESHKEFLTKHLSDHLWVYYDTDDKIKQILMDGTALALIHNPFYVDVRTIDAIRLKGKTYGKETTIEGVIAAWKQAGVTHLLLHRPYVLDDFVNQEYLPGGATALPEGERAKLLNYLELRYKDDNNTLVWELK